MSKEWDLLHKYKLPNLTKVRLTLFWTSNAKSNPAPGMIQAAETLLKEHNLTLDVFPAQKTPQFTLNFQEQVYLDEHKDALRHLAHKAYQDSRPRLPVIFVPFRGPQGPDTCDTNGVTIQRGATSSWLAYVLINSELQGDGITLLHEIGHAAGLGHEPSSPSDEVFNFMSYANGRNDMLRKQVIKISQAYFAQ
jgi:hypothetical protein